MTEQKQSKIPSFAAMRRKSGSAESRRKPNLPGRPTQAKPMLNKPSSLIGVCSSGGAGVGDRSWAENRTDPDWIKNNPQVASAIEVLSPPAAPSAPSTGKKIYDYVLGPLQMHCLREFAAGRCDRLEITPAYKVPFIEGVSVGRSSENRARPAVMRCERRIYSRETGAFAYVSLRLIGSELRASRCSATVEGELGIRHEDEENGGVF